MAPKQLELAFAITPDERGVRVAPGVPHWDASPIAVVEGGRLRAVTAAAGRMRVRAGMTVPEARAVCAALELIAWDELVLQAEVMRVTAALLVASPQVTPAAGAPGTWWVGAGGLEGIGGERALVRTLVRVGKLWHPAPRVGIASSCVAARAATWAERNDAAERTLRAAGDADGHAGQHANPHADREAVVVPAGGCARYLASAPLALVPMEGELRASLLSLGLRSAGAFAALAAGDVEARWGAVGMAAWRLAHGEDLRRPVLARLEATRSAGAELAVPTATMEPVLFLVRAALERLVPQLVAEARGAAALAITLTLDDGRGALPSGGVAHTVTREVRPARPLARVSPLFERCRGLLDRWPLSAPVCGVCVTVTATAPLGGEQGNLLDVAWRDPGAAEAALERLRAELGPNVVVRPTACDEHRPERAGAWVDVDAAGTVTWGADDAGAAAGASRGAVMGADRGGAIGVPAGAHGVASSGARGVSAGKLAEEHATVVRGGQIVGGIAFVGDRAAAGGDGRARGGPPTGNLAIVSDSSSIESTRGRAESLPGRVDPLSGRAESVRGGPPTGNFTDPGPRSDIIPLHPVAPHSSSVFPSLPPAARPSGTTDDTPTAASPSVPALPPLPAATRLLEQPEPADVECTRDGAPATIGWRGRRIPVVRAMGPERLSGDWWRDSPYGRDYWRCIITPAPASGRTDRAHTGPDAVGEQLLLYRDRMPVRSQWYVHGWHD